MRIDKDNFNKLTQGDRIEFRQKYSHIKDKKSPSFFYSINQAIMLMIFIFVSDIWCKVRFGVSLGIRSIHYCFEVIFIMILVSIMSDLIFYYIYLKKVKDLEDEYFKIEVKK